MATSKIAKQTLYKELWSGTWSSGSITVTDSDKYAVFLAIADDTPLLGVRMSNTQIKFFGVVYGSSRQYIKTVAVANNGNTWTNSGTSNMGHTANGNHTASAVAAINKIIGIIPY